MEGIRIAAAAALCAVLAGGLCGCSGKDAGTAAETQGSLPEAAVLSAAQEDVQKAVDQAAVAAGSYVEAATDAVHGALTQANESLQALADDADFQAARDAVTEGVAATKDAVGAAVDSLKNSGVVDDARAALNETVESLKGIDTSAVDELGESSQAALEGIQSDARQTLDALKGLFATTSNE